MIIQDSNWLNRSQIDCYGKTEDVTTNTEWGVKKVFTKKLHLNIFMKHLFKTQMEFKKKEKTWKI